MAVGQESPPRRLARRLSPRAAVLAAAVLVPLIAASTLVHFLSQTGLRRLSTTGMVPNLSTDLPPGQVACQPGMFVPAGTGHVQLNVRTHGRPGPPLDVDVSKAGSRLTSGRAPGGYGAGELAIRLAEVRSDATGASLCIRNRGSVPVQFFGDLAPPGGAQTVQTPGVVQRHVTLLRVDWLESRPRSWFSESTRTAERYWFGKASFLGPWTMWFAAAVLIALSAAAVASVARGDRE